MSYAEVYHAASTTPTASGVSRPAWSTGSASRRRCSTAARPPFFRWYVDGTLNTCYNALDRHVIAGRGDQAALIYDSPVTGARRTYSYAQLLDDVAAFAGALRALGVEKGDRVVVYMPMIPETVVTMLACARIGAVHSVVFGGFAAAELAVRIDDAKPVVVVTASCGVEPNRVVEYTPLLSRALGIAEHISLGPASCGSETSSVPTLVEGRDIDWATAMAMGRGEPAECVPVAATDPLYVLYTSGTTGKPKGIVRDNGGHAVALCLVDAQHLRHRTGPGVVGRVRRRLGGRALLHRLRAAARRAPQPCCTRGNRSARPTPARSGGSPRSTASRACSPRRRRSERSRRRTPRARSSRGTTCPGCGTSSSPGSGSIPDTYAWASEKLGIPVVDNWWQTETGWPIVANPRGLEPMPIKAGSPSVPVPGYDVRDPRRARQRRSARTRRARSACACHCLRARCRRCGETTTASSRRTSSAFDGYYLSGDGGYLDDDGYVFVMGRTDDVINVAGHRLSTGSMEAVIAKHPAVAECAVIGVADALKGQSAAGVRGAEVRARRRPRRARQGADRRGARRGRPGRCVQGRLRRRGDCRRRARARSCARPCARSPTARTRRSRRRSRTRQCSEAMKSALGRSDAVVADPSSARRASAPSALATTLCRRVTDSSWSATVIARRPALIPNQRRGSGSQRGDRWLTQGASSGRSAGR